MSPKFVHVVLPTHLKTFKIIIDLPQSEIRMKKKIETST